MTAQYTSPSIYPIGPNIRAIHQSQGNEPPSATSGSKYSQTNTSGISQKGSLQDLTAGWNDERQGLFEEYIIFITAACDFPLSWIDNPRVILFFQIFIPQAKLPSQQTLSNQILSCTLKDVDLEISKEIQGSPWANFTTL
ncbi:hypothetical protein P691DRAFT_769825 [Macrolepiota fuliginosa MF-IS2]|uniref:Uncharacterized protein n=1 Tax=Macrolepiota fuliginosa MF-IS2 TaxID=1400762 RepID=A0A9P5WX12_9AGAR|nr:hypothetical protein P691DRAFT_769825 [Macrolepiota fuliginosa MF-IS2]